METIKKFDAVKMMREIRDRHHKEYSNNKSLRVQRLAEIRKKYAHQIKRNAGVNI